MSGQIQNLYHKRTVAAASSKPCFICYKPTTTVLITPDNRDFFYVCPGHLADKGFASPISQADEKTPEQKAKDEALQKEIELVKKEYEEKMRKRKGKKKDNKEDQKKDKEKEDKKNEENEEAKEEKERDEKIKALEKGSSANATEPTADTGPRIFALHKNIYQMRMNRIREAQMAKRAREQLKNPTTFPAVPKDL